MKKYNVVIKLNSGKLISDYIKADNDHEARKKAFKHVIQRFRPCRPVLVGVKPA